MRNSPASVMAAMRRTLDIPRSIFAPAGQGFEASRHEQLETIFCSGDHLHAYTKL